LVSTCPFGIPSAVMDANDLMLPFAYVRAEQKDHGLKKQTEGVVEAGSHAFLVDYHIGDSYVGIAKEVLEAKDVTVNQVVTEDISSILRPADVRGRHILQVEDLVSTGGSCVKEIDAYRKAGATVSHCLSIFSYQLDKALGDFRDAGVMLLPALTYPVLLEEAVAAGYVPGDSRAALDEWRAAPFEWGENHRHPPVKK
ncbi:hypothetical protein KY359_02180, partial [Candidatus Woesearchaeota archaeon]|nr:hypothetical protein [Candidatus Woesearchaeota archaeon]